MLTLSSPLYAVLAVFSLLTLSGCTQINHYQQVNSYVNTFPYKEDTKTRVLSDGKIVKDHWDNILITGSGDCEDYVIGKASLLDRPDAVMTLVYVTSIKEPHAILYVPGVGYLDNRHDYVLTTLPNDYIKLGDLPLKGITK